eukprot:3732144-Rhodomonas_salina.2
MSSTSSSVAATAARWDPRAARKRPDITARRENLLASESIDIVTAEGRVLVRSEVARPVSGRVVGAKQEAPATAAKITVVLSILEAWMVVEFGPNQGEWSLC